MATTPRILGVITARGGSKGIPGKNIKELGGKPLIVYTIEAAQKSNLITHLIVSTDDEAIAEVARGAGAEVPFIRPAELAQDSTPHLPVMQHALRFMEERLGEPFDYTVILQPTSPFRTPDDIDMTLQKLIDTGADSAVSLVEVENSEHPAKVKKLEGDRVLPYAIAEPEGTRRQDLPTAYRRSEAVYAMRRNLIMGGRLYGDTIVGHVVPRERYIGIDYPLDWVKAEYMLAELKKKGYDL
ncbi:MAG TPA: acylneuraminate cytidylyltransferase family protein [Candidatus Paceibacterota bacterium]